MDIDFDSKIGILTDFEPGTFFATRTDQRPIFGMAAVYGGSPVGILFNLAVQPSEPFPSMVQAQFLGGQDLIGLMGAYLAPSLSQSGMEFNSAQRDGPGSLIMTEDGTFMRVARRAEGFFYLDVGVGSVASSRPSGIEIPRWSVRILDKGGAALKLFEFDGPNPL